MRLKQVMIFALAAVLGCAVWAQSAPAPVNPHATPEARALLAYLQSISGKGTITGQHNFPNDGSRWTDQAYDLTGKYPGLYGEDFGFSAGDDKDSVLSRPATIQEVKRQYKNGAVIALMWHAVRPTEDEPVTFRDSVQGHLTDYEWQQLLTPGSPLYNRWCAQVDVIAGYLRQLRDAHVPVLFRPYHEINGNWFWWGGRPGKGGSSALYRQLYDRFVNVHHLDNLVWVWNVNSPSGSAGPIADYYPGAQFADVAAIDIYGEFKQEYYTSMFALADGKPIALAEVGGLPSPEVLEQQPRWAYFMAWSGVLDGMNTLDQINAVYHGPRALNRDDPRLAGPMAAIREDTAKRTGGEPEADPVIAGASAEAKALLARLHSAPGQAVLSGQENEAGSGGVATEAVTAATGKEPAIYSVELGIDSQPPGPNPADARSEAPKAQSSLDSVIDSHIALVSEALKAQAKHAIVSFTWYPARPTDSAPASGHGQLTDFEWNELLTPGTELNKRWCAQVDDVASMLLNLQKSGVAVLWNPLPESNGKDFWWAGRKGAHGSAELYRQLFDRLVNRDKLGNLVWVWEAAPPDFRSGGSGVFSDFFPGLLYADALEVRLNELNPRFPAGRFLAQISAGKAVGVELTGNLPPPEAFTERSGWAWFLATPPADPATRAEAWRKLLGDPHVAALAPAQ
jgi:mannan endo-1,4-beta-mannosidase